MKKQFKKTLESIQTRSNRSTSNTVREFFNCVSYTMIMNSLFQLERRELFYLGSNIYGFNQLAIKSGFIQKSITLTDRYQFLRVKQNQLVAQRVLEIDKEKKAA
ncbi:hypothetical protein LKR60_004515 [Salmonella enterica]|nr:hypothetical protein [Salmonella enterica]